MPYGMYLSAAGAEAQSRTMDVLANNMANIDTVGFKPDFAMVLARHSQAIEQGLDSPGSTSINDLSGGAAMDRTVTDFSPGGMKHTKINTDLAIDDQDGSTFFMVEQDGEKMLTRAGNFRFSADGRLETQEGAAVLTAEEQPVTIDPSLGNPVFTEHGTVMQSGSHTPLALVRPASFGDLVKSGKNQFKSLGEVTPVPNNERSIRSGYLEMSSTRPTQGMVDMIKASRAYEANVKLIQHQDHVLGSLVTRVLRQ